MLHALYLHDCSSKFIISNPGFKSLKFNTTLHPQFFSCSSSIKTRRRQRRRLSSISNEFDGEIDEADFSVENEDVNDPGVKAALSMLRFYKREISPLMPKSCRYVPTCSEYSMIAYKKYGVAKGTVLTAWRLCRCNPLGGSGFDPPRWFGEASALDE